VCCILCYYDENWALTVAVGGSCPCQEKQQQHTQVGGQAETLGQDSISTIITKLKA